MNSSWPRWCRGACVWGLLLLGGCHEAADCSGTASSGLCPPPVAGQAEVTGQVLDSTGTPQRRVKVTISCPAAGVYSDRTTSAGRFRVRIPYPSPIDTAVVHPDSAGYFLTECRAFGPSFTGMLLFLAPVAPTGAPLHPVEIALTPGR